MLAMLCTKRGMVHLFPTMSPVLHTAGVAVNGRAVTAAVRTERDLQELQGCAFRQPGCTFFETRAPILCYIEHIVLVENEVGPVRRYFSSENSRYHSRGVGMSDCRSCLCRNFSGRHLTCAEKHEAFHRNHVQRECVY